MLIPELSNEIISSDVTPTCCAEPHKLFGGLLQEEYFAFVNLVWVSALPARG